MTLVRDISSTGNSWRTDLHLVTRTEINAQDAATAEYIDREWCSQYSQVRGLQILLQRSCPGQIDVRAQDVEQCHLENDPHGDEQNARHNAVVHVEFSEEIQPLPRQTHFIEISH